MSTRQGHNSYMAIAKLYALSFLSYNIKNGQIGFYLKVRYTMLTNQMKSLYEAKLFYGFVYLKAHADEAQHEH